MPYSDRIHRICDHTFFQASLRPGTTVIDLGANLGQFTQAVENRFGCSVIAVEANPELCKNLVSNSRVKYLNAAICDCPGEIPFNVSFLNETSSIFKLPAETRTQEVLVTGITLAQLFERHALQRVELLKVDIEGAELQMFDSCPDALLQRIVQISVEFHDFCGLGTAGDVERIVARMRRLNFDVIRFSKSNFDVLFLNRLWSPISWSGLFWGRTVSKYLLGFQRRLNKLRLSIKRPVKVISFACR